MTGDLKVLEILIIKVLLKKTKCIAKKKNSHTFIQGRSYKLNDYFELKTNTYMRMKKILMKVSESLE